MAIAAPVLLAPLGALIYFDEKPPMSEVELAISSLPTAGSDAPAEGSGTALLGTARLPNGLSLPLYANSARVEAGRIGRADIAAATRDTDQPFGVTEFAAAHPRSMRSEDLMLGSLGMVYSTPMNMDLSLKLFEEFCNAAPDTSYYGVTMDSLPIDPNLRRALERYSTTSSRGGVFCSRLYRDEF